MTSSSSKRYTSASYEQTINTTTQQQVHKCNTTTVVLRGEVHLTSSSSPSAELQAVCFITSLFLRLTSSHHSCSLLAHALNLNSMLASAPHAAHHMDMRYDTAPATTNHRKWITSFFPNLDRVRKHHMSTALGGSAATHTQSRTNASVLR